MSPSTWFVSDAPYAGGAEIYLTWLMRSLGPQRAGLIAVDRPGLRPWIESTQDEGFRVERLADGPWWRQALQLRRVVGTVGARCVHVNLPGPYDGMLATAPAMVRWAGVRRVVVTEHLPGVGRVGKRFYVKRTLLPAVSRAISVCPEHASILTGVFGYREDQVVAIANGVPDPNVDAVVAAVSDEPMPGDLAAQERGGGVRFVQVGALDPRKGGDVLLAAAQRLHRQNVAFQLWFVGAGPAESDWKQWTRASNLEDRVHFAGSRGDVHAIWRSADVAVLASHREGLPLSLVEAMAHGLPIVASAVDGIVGLVRPQETGTLVGAGDVAGFAWALSELARDAGRRHRWGHAARRRYERYYTLERMLARTLGELHAGAAEGSAS